MDHVQIVVQVACFVLLNLAQIADETLLMVCLFLQHQFLRNQAALLIVEHCRRQRRRARRCNPYFWKLPRPNQSWFEIHFNDRRIPEEYFRKQLQMNRRTFDMLLNVLRPAVYAKIQDCVTGSLQKKYSHLVCIVWHAETVMKVLGQISMLED